MHHSQAHIESLPAVGFQPYSSDSQFQQKRYSQQNVQLHQKHPNWPPQTSESVQCRDVQAQLSVRPSEQQIKFDNPLQGFGFAGQLLGEENMHHSQAHLESLPAGGFQPYSSDSQFQQKRYPQQNVQLHQKHPTWPPHTSESVQCDDVQPQESVQQSEQQFKFDNSLQGFGFAGQLPEENMHRSQAHPEAIPAVESPPDFSDPQSQQKRYPQQNIQLPQKHPIWPPLTFENVQCGDVQAQLSLQQSEQQLKFDNSLQGFGFGAHMQPDENMHHSQTHHESIPAVGFHSDGSDPQSQQKLNFEIQLRESGSAAHNQNEQEFQPAQPQQLQLDYMETDQVGQLPPEPIVQVNELDGSAQLSPEQQLSSLIQTDVSGQLPHEPNVQLIERDESVQLSPEQQFSLIQPDVSVKLPQEQQVKLLHTAGHQTSHRNLPISPPQSEHDFLHTDVQHNQHTQTGASASISTAASATARNVCSDTLPDIPGDSKLRYLLDSLIYRELVQQSGPGLDGAVAYHVDRDWIINLAKQEAVARAECSEFKLEWLTKAINRCLDASPLNDRVPRMFSQFKLRIDALSNQIRERISQFNRNPLIEKCRNLPFAELSKDTALIQRIYDADKVLLSGIYMTIAIEMMNLTLRRQQYVDIITALSPHLLFFFHEKVIEDAVIVIEKMSDEVNPSNEYIFFIIREHLLETCEFELKACRTCIRDFGIKKTIVKNVFPEIIKLAKSKNVDPNASSDIFRDMDHAMKLFLTGESKSQQNLTMCRGLATRHRLPYPLDLPNNLLTDLQNQFKQDLKASLNLPASKTGTSDASSVVV